MILCFLLICTVCCVGHSAAVDEVFSVATSDHKVYANVKDGFYKTGSVWVCTNEDNPAKITIYYRPGVNKLYYAQDFSIDDGPQPQERHRKALWRDITQKYEDWQKVCSEKYKVPAADLTCAATVHLREMVANKCIYDGVQHPEFYSWARYMSDNDCEASNYLGRKVIYSACSQYIPGDMWIAKEDGRPMLFYKPDFGPDWMYYRYDLQQNAGWPKNWLMELVRLRGFAASGEYYFKDYTSTLRVDKTIAVAKAVLSGRTAGWNEDVWFAWRPECQKDDPFLQEQPTDRLQQGAVIDGVYQPGSVWMTRWRSKKTACRILLKDGSAFQIATANFPKSTPECLWLAPTNGAVALDFINEGTL